ncbi:FAD-dependent oxidoreductase [Rhodoferax sp.]|uniref:NAD(P)/FAD-dependent oxidoreductase n=1 Tax=Rhodoferax sp. TaxID=50421 RepID=UPI002627FD0D|nr:FAD-dependent oxidoreductase [Rhodoferax sp.]MDD4943344.1 FAD-dependent oxidoreductase [Rhodoferax sp.]MDD5479338.1 FAD-dependent oxidoreductase [Rhodoferax sp.]
MKIAIVGSGISGLAVAHQLRGQADLTLFEAGSYFGGHTHTVDITLPTAQGPVTHGVDTGFLVFNERTYPKLIALFEQLQVATAKSDMSFSVQTPGAHPGQSLEWSGTSLNTVFAQRGNLIKPDFWRMLRDLLRFNALATQLAEQGQDAQLTQPLAQFLAAHHFSEAFSNWYLLPMLGCIWSCPVEQMLQFPVATMIRFCHNHGLIQVTNRPQWWTVVGGAKHYVNHIVAQVPDRRLNSPVQRIERDHEGVTLWVNGQSERFDKVVLACHAPQALALLAQPSAQERITLGALRTQSNRAVLHTDASVLPRHPRAWAAWNYQRLAHPVGVAGAQPQGAPVCLHYLLNRLQPLPFAQPVLVSLNPLTPIDPARVLGEFDYAHPVFDLAAIAAQRHVGALQGQQHSYFCGAWTGYGFHEDGLASGLAVAQLLRPQ